ncbi:MAG: porphobilinogen synthase [Candidatus Omnitrophota bacterium]
MNIEVDKLIYPLFVKKGRNLKEEILSMPGVYRFSPDLLVKEVGVLKKLGIRRILIFGIPLTKDPKGTSSYVEGNMVSSAVKLIKFFHPEMTIITDVCLCNYTTHGHCGIIKKRTRKIDNIATLKALSRIALSHANAGADCVAPSAKAKNEVRAIRKTLDSSGFKHIKIMGYSAKFASNFYGPFRDIADSAPRFGDRKSYQLDYARADHALDRAKQDIKEGADIIMVKPTLGYLDIVKNLKHRFKHPLAAYNVSGEYSMVKNGVKAGFWKEKDMVLEIISSIKRSGADYIITYHAKDIAKWLKKR